LLPVDFAQYRHYSQRFKAIITDIAPVMENRGVDEVYIDFTDVPGGQRQGGARAGAADPERPFLMTPASPAR